MKRMMLVAVAASVAACADEIRPENPEPVDPVDGAHVTHVDNGDGSTTSTVDASSMSEWIYLDLDAGAEVDAGDAAWDLAFQRFLILVDGGVSGDAGVEVAILDGADFAGMTAAPTDGWITDAADGDDEDAEPDLALGGWYAYDPATHVLSPNDLVYVVRTGEGAYVKLQMLDYYDDAGTSGFPRFQWAPVGAPAR
jgi:hypothetical protein